MVTDKALAHIHWEANTAKYTGYFTGFLEGIVASGAIEPSEVEALLDMCA